MKINRLFVSLLALFLGVSYLHAAENPDKNKESYIKKADSEVQEWTGKLKSLQERSEKSGAKTRQELDHRIKVVDEKLAQARKKLEDLRTSGEGTWKSLRQGLEDALRDVKRALRTAQSFFNKNDKKATKEGSS